MANPFSKVNPNYQPKKPIILYYLKFTFDDLQILDYLSEEIQEHNLDPKSLLIYIDYGEIRTLSNITDFRLKPEQLRKLAYIFTNISERFPNQKILDEFISLSQ